MSRIGKRVLTIPTGVNVDVNESTVTVKGPKGELKLDVIKTIKVNIDGTSLTVEKLKEDKFTNQMHGTTNANINNMIIGVSTGFEKKLESIGVGYRFALKGNELVVTAGYSHPVNVQIPTGITLESPSNTELLIKGIDKQAVGQFAAEVRAIREPEPYKGKGIRYSDEHIIRKEGKKAA